MLGKQRTMQLSREDLPNRPPRDIRPRGGLFDGALGCCPECNDVALQDENTHAWFCVTCDWEYLALNTIMTAS